MTALRLESSDDRRLEPGTRVERVRVPCGCGQGARSIPFQMLRDAIDWFRRFRPPPEMVVGSWFCGDCKWIVKVKAKHLHIC